MAGATACPDWRDRIVGGRSLIAAEPLFRAEAKAALDVFKSLHVVDVIGRPTFRQVGERWIFDFVAAIFGAYDPDTARRHIREAFLCVAKKNGKSTLAAGIMLTALIRNERHSNEALILAPTIEAAQNSFKPAADMIRANPELHAAEGGFLHIQDHIRTITHLSTGATLKVIAADTATAVGKKAAYVLVDELWEFGKRPHADAMLREATGGLVARPEGFVISITTQSDEPPAGVFKDKLDYARNVRDGLVDDPKFLPVIYEFPPEMIEAQAYLDPENFYVTNPNLDRSVSAEWLEDELRKEVKKGPETRNTFLAKHLNVEIGLNLRSDRWPGAEFWPQCATALTLDELLDRSEVVVVGIDGGGLDDLLGLAVVGRCRDTRRWLIWCRAWAHPIVLERRKEIASRLHDFEAEGTLTMVRRPGDDVAEVADVVMRIDAMRLLPEGHAVAVDTVGIHDVVEELAARGFDTERVTGIAQGYKMNGAIKTTERRLAGGEIEHDGSALMSWVVGNAKAEAKGNAIAVTKQAAGTAKIDPLVAIFDAVTLMGTNPVAHGYSVYETRGIRFA